MSLLDWSHLLVAGLCTMSAYWCLRDKVYVLLPVNVFFAAVNVVFFVAAIREWAA